MNFIDPSEVKCTNCNDIHFYSVKELLLLKAICTSCDSSLAEVGREMQEGLNKWSAFVAKAELEFESEAKE